MQRIIPISLITAGILLLIFSAVYLLSSQVLENPNVTRLPDQLAGQRLTDSLNGPEAVDEINRLHGINFTLSYGLVGIYGNELATIWVSGSPDPETARQMIMDMRDRIAEVRSPFINARVREIGNQLVYELEGLGKKHFYFQSGSRVIWLAAEPMLAEQALREVLEYYPE